MKDIDEFTEDYVEYDVYNYETGEYLGGIETNNLPDSLEIDGIEYIARK